MSLIRKDFKKSSSYTFVLSEYDTLITNEISDKEKTVVKDVKDLVIIPKDAHLF